MQQARPWGRDLVERPPRAEKRLSSRQFTISALHVSGRPEGRRYARESPLFFFFHPVKLEQERHDSERQPLKMKYIHNDA